MEYLPNIEKLSEEKRLECQRMEEFLKSHENEQPLDLSVLSQTGMEKLTNIGQDLELEINHVERDVPGNKVLCYICNKNMF